MFPNPYSADVFGNLDTAGLCVDMIWGYVVNVEMKHAAAETVKKIPSVISVGGDMRQADRSVTVVILSLDWIISDV